MGTSGEVQGCFLSGEVKILLASLLQLRLSQPPRPAIFTALHFMIPCVAVIGSDIHKLSRLSMLKPQSSAAVNIVEHKLVCSFYKGKECLSRWSQFSTGQRYEWKTCAVRFARRRELAFKKLGQACV
jgi:hypothetical protein